MSMHHQFVQENPSSVFLAAAVLALGSLTGCHHRCEVLPVSITVDTNGNDFLEPGQPGSVEPSLNYKNVASGNEGCPISDPCPAVASMSRMISDFTGPLGGQYTVLDQTASYSIPIGDTRSCVSTGDCYSVLVTAPVGRPVLHWDTMLTEGALEPETPATNWVFPLNASALAPACSITSYGAQWTLHVGHSFSDVDAASGFYPFIEKLLHNGITSGCGSGAYCPAAGILREQMSVFLLKSNHEAGFAPPACIGVFQDVPCPGPFADWIEEVVNEGIIDPCGSQEFCPATVVTRRDMAAWLIKAELGRAYVPPPATGIFADVPVTDPSAPWIEFLYRTDITAGCGTQPLRYCPDDPNTRAQMAVFLGRTFHFTF